MYVCVNKHAPRALQTRVCIFGTKTTCRHSFFGCSHFNFIRYVGMLLAANLLLVGVSDQTGTNHTRIHIALPLLGARPEITCRAALYVLFEMG